MQRYGYSSKTSNNFVLLLRKIKKYMQEKVTRAELRNMYVGQTKIIGLVHPKKVTSARVTCRQLYNEEGLKFDFKPDYKTSSVCITRVE